MFMHIHTLLFIVHVDCFLLRNFYATVAATITEGISANTISLELRFVAGKDLDFLNYTLFKIKKNFKRIFSVSLKWKLYGICTNLFNCVTVTPRQTSYWSGKPDTLSTALQLINSFYILKNNICRAVQLMLTY